MNKNLTNIIVSLTGLTILGFLTFACSQSKTQDKNNLLISDKSKVESVSNKTSNKSQSIEKVLIFAGSGANLSITRILVTEFNKSNPDIKIEVPSSIGSTGGIRAIVDGTIDLGLASRTLNEKEKKFGLRVIPYAQTAVVIGANSSVIDDNITFMDLVNIYKGTKNRWSDGQEIIVLSREPGDSSNLILFNNIPGFKEVYEQSQKDRLWQTFFTDQENNKALVGTPFAIGLTDTGLIDNEQPNIKILKVNGISPTAENVINGKYTLTKTLNFILPSGEIPSDVQAFINFVSSDEGEKILKKHGYFPVR